MTNIYSVYGIKTKRRFFGSTLFKPEESNKIIQDLASRIEEFEKVRTIKTDNKIATTENSDRITEANITSEDGIIECKISYEEELSDLPSRIVVKLNYEVRCSHTDMPKYHGLVKIIRDMGFKFL